MPSPINPIPTTNFKQNWRRIAFNFSLLWVGVISTVLWLTPPQVAYADGPTFNEFYPVGGGLDQTQRMALGDLNGDGAFDLVVGYGDSRPLTLCFNYLRATRRMNCGPLSQSSMMVTSLALGDMNGDGYLDVVAGGGQDVIYFNNGTGVFTDTQPYKRTFSTRLLDDLGLGDIDGDGDWDVVGVTKGINLALIYLNDAGGNFPVTRTIAVTDSASLDLGDLDGDLDVDLVIGQMGAPSLIYLNDGNGLFTNTRLFDGASRNIQSLALGDLDQDGDLDIVAGRRYQTSTVFLNASGYFTTALDFGNPSSSTRALGLADLDHDGDVDIVAGNDDPLGSAAPDFVYFNDGRALFPLSVAFGIGVDQTYAVVVGDLDADGDVDIVSGNYGAQSMVYFNDGAHKIKTNVGLYASFTDFSAVVFGDMNNDGWTDIVMGNGGSDSFDQSKIFLNDGQRGFASTKAVGLATDRVSALAVGDLDGDKDLDLVVNHSNNNLQSYAALNDGQGNFYMLTNTVPIGLLSDQFSSPVLGDIDNDGDLDLLVRQIDYTRSAAERYGRIYFNDGQAHFTDSLLIFSTTLPINVLAMGDLDQDGDLDIVNGGNQVFINRGAGRAFETRAYGHPFLSAKGIALGDMDNDGDVDIVVGNQLRPSVIYYNDGAGYFDEFQFVSTGEDTTFAIAVNDIDGDSDLDILMVNYLQPNRVLLNTGLRQFSVQWLFGWEYQQWDETLAVGDLDRDGLPDIVTNDFNNQLTPIYWNALRPLTTTRNTLPQVAVTTPGRTAGANFYAWSEILDQPIVPISYTLADLEGDPVGTLRAYFSPDGGGRWLPAVAASGTQTSALFTLGRAPQFDGVADYAVITNVTGLPQGNSAHTVEAWIFAARTPTVRSWPLLLGNPGAGALHWNFGNDRRLYIGVWGGAQVQVPLTLNTWTHIASVFNGANLSVYVNGQLLGSPVAQFAITGTTLSLAQAQSAEAYFAGQMDEVRVWGRALTPAEIQANFKRVVTPTSNSLLGYWRFNERQGPLAYNTVPQGNPLQLSPATQRMTPTLPYVYYWDAFASGFFGQSDNVTFRLEAYPSHRPTPAGVATPPTSWPYHASTSYPFRVRGTQVRVLQENGSPAVGARVYRLAANQPVGGALLTNGVEQAFTTDVHGFLQGRDQLNVGERLLALYPITATNNYTLYYTSGEPTLLGITAYTLTTSGVQTLTVSAAHPLYLFDLNLSLEWDAHRDLSYLEELRVNLQRASAYLYDFTDGQVALGQIKIFQNADDWAYSHIIVRASNRVRPFAAQGGLVTTVVTDAQHADVVYGPGQVTLGATWNRYGNPGQNLGTDWAVILAHELGHYLLYHDDTYLGLDANGYLKAVSSCTGSAMGDVYSPDNTEFVFDDAFWQANCSETLAAQTLHRTEWQTMRLWYPALISPTARNVGPRLLPFDFTSVQIYDPLTSTNTLDDPTFYLDYAQQQVSSTEARAYLIRADAYVYDLGAPLGGQNRVIARGAQVGDRLCVFDPPYHQFGCETLTFSDNRLQLREEVAWAPVIQLSPVNSVTVDISIEGLGVITYPVRAQLYPDLGAAETAITLTASNGIYSGTFHLNQPVMAGNAQLWVEEPSAPRREAVVAFSIGGNPANLRGGGANLRGGGANLRGGGANLRGGGANLRGGGAPVISPDGQMIFFTPNPIIFAEGQFYTIQSMASLPSTPAGRVVLGQGYRLVATAGTPVLTGSISIQYLTNDVLNAGASENQLVIYFYDGQTWEALPTVVDTYFNLATAPSHGVGVYVLLASLRVPFETVGWNLFAYALPTAQPITQALLSISGYYTMVYGYYPTDVADPWKLYDVTAPAWANDLNTLDSGHGYWINVSRPITLHLSITASLGSAPTNEPPSPPTTFYGLVASDTRFTPQANQMVVARIGDTLCGQGLTRAMSNTIVYVVDVLSAGERAGCGAPGKIIQFQVDAYPMTPSGAWDNRQSWSAPLRPAQLLYLPIIQR